MVINNLRMATKYSFHVRKQTKKSEQKSPRADFSDNRIDLIHGQTIIIPTKGCTYSIAVANNMFDRFHKYLINS